MTAATSTTVVVIVFTAAVVLVLVGFVVGLAVGRATPRTPAVTARPACWNELCDDAGHDHTDRDQVRQ